MVACGVRSGGAGRSDPAANGRLILLVGAPELLLEIGLLVPNRDQVDDEPDDGNQQHDPGVGECDPEARLQKSHRHVHGISRETIDARRDDPRCAQPRLGILPGPAKEPEGPGHQGGADRDDGAQRAAERDAQGEDPEMERDAQPEADQGNEGRRKSNRRTVIGSRVVAHAGYGRTGERNGS